MGDFSAVSSESYPTYSYTRKPRLRVAQLFREIVLVFAFKSVPTLKLVRCLELGVIIIINSGHDPGPLIVETSPAESCRV